MRRRTKTVNLNLLNPFSDSSWDDLIARHPQVSIFHQRGWLQALVRTYGYELYVLTSAAPGEPLKDGLLLCQVSSWMTGTRLVSLPFSDHCEPLLNEGNEAPVFAKWLSEQCRERQWSYVEIRPLGESQGTVSCLQPNRSYWFHELDLSPSLEQLFGRMHKNSFRRKIHRAEKERLSYEAGRSMQFLDEFYRLLLMTRRRHQLLPQPRVWFENLVACMGDKLQISLARKNGTAVAAMITLRHGSCVVYKYGCSDAKFHNLGGMPFLFWKLVEESKLSGSKRIDLGRSDLDNEGLVVFKDRLGSQKKQLTYYRYTNPEAAIALMPWSSHRFRRLSLYLPDFLLSAAGRLLYKHMG
jgi:CelD/BcsL family acetyltransferase involved in cellulose biosynthesis